MGDVDGRESHRQEAIPRHSRSTVQDGVDRWAGPACLAEIPHGFVEINRAGGCMAYTVQPFYTRVFLSRLNGDTTPGQLPNLSLRNQGGSKPSLPGPS